MKIERNRRKTWSVLALVMVLLLTTVCGAACGGEKEGVDETLSAEEQAQQDAIIQVGEKYVGLDEIMFYVLCLRQQYEGYFGEEIWSVDVGGRSFEEMCKEDVFNEIVQLKVITAMAESQGVEVTEDEAAEIQDTVLEQMEEIDELDALLYHIDQELLESIYHDNYLSSKMFEVVTSDVDTNVSEEEAHHAQFLVLTLLTEGEDKDYNQIQLDEEARAQTLELAEELRTQLLEVMEDGTPEEVAAEFESLALTHSDLAEIHQVLGRGDMDDAAFDRIAFGLRTGGISRVIEGEHAIYLVYCVNELDEDATAEAKEEIILARQDAAFREIYEGWLQEVTIHVDEEKWAAVSFLAEDLLGVPEQSAEE